MLFDKSARLSARVFGHVLNLPLYDADCCPAARECLAVGDVAGAIAEWQRLADLGSGGARCVLAYLHLMGAPSIPIDLGEARRIALSAVAGARGYANYLLACIALTEKQPSEAAKYFVESRKAGFVPAGTHFASVAIRSVSDHDKQQVVKILRQSFAAGHWPALLRLAGVYLSGQLGFAKRVIGIVLLLPAFIKCALGFRYRIFSIHYFQYVTNSKQSLFNEESISRIQKTGSLAAGDSYVRILRCTHAIAAILVAIVLVRRQGVAWDSGGALLGWTVLAVWPYGLSYLMASANNARSRVALVVQSLLMVFVTVLTCDAYVGHLLETRLAGWSIALATAVQAFLLLMASLAGIDAEKRFQETTVPVPYRARVFWAHAIFGVAAAGLVFSRPEIWGGDYLHYYGLDLITNSMGAALPYAVCAGFSWGLVTASRWRPWAYLAVLLAGTALVAMAYSGNIARHATPVELFGIALVQLFAFGLAAEWALDGTEW
jgi:hypothetical protein